MSAARKNALASFNDSAHESAKRLCETTTFTFGFCLEIVQHYGGNERLARLHLDALIARGVKG